MPPCITNFGNRALGFENDEARLRQLQIAPARRAYNFVAMPDRSPSAGLWRDSAAVLVLALAPAIGVGIARFAYSLLLPDMRMSLEWSYAAAGFMNTINAAGYLVGALLAAAAIRRVGQFGAVLYGSLACVAALALSAASGNFLILSAARLAAGIGGAIAFVGGGVAAARISQRHPAHTAFLLSLYYVGPGLGIAVSGIIVPALLQAMGQGSWWIAWGALALITAIFCVVLAGVRTNEPSRDPAKMQARAPLLAMGLVLAGYTIFSAGTIAYMTFMIAWLVDDGAGAFTQSTFWSLLGLGGIASPLLWSWLIAGLRGARNIAVLCAITLAMILAAMLSGQRILLFVSGFVFGSVFFAVVTATTAFVRRYLPPATWPSGIAAMTVAFGLGQTIGPVLSGAISDATGDLSIGLLYSAGLLVVAAVLALLQPEIAAAPSRDSLRSAVDG
jgi:predicted MFS family arabinose efflux permease